jgi:hypothetical protein
MTAPTGGPAEVVPSWSRNNLACATTWTTLLVLDQLSEAFADSGDLRMDQLGFWNAAASSDMRALQARSLATMMDNMFRVIRHATYEEGVTGVEAKRQMVAILTDGTSTVRALAAANDGNYRFLGEGHET